MIEAKPCWWKGVFFRSTLERDGARYFDVRQVGWEYERHTFQIDAFRTYTPDFLLWPNEEGSAFVEFKPTYEQAVADDRMMKLSSVHPRPELYDFVTIAGTPRACEFRVFSNGDLLEVLTAADLIDQLEYRWYKWRRHR